jgi:hypothetical protein
MEIDDDRFKKYFNKFLKYRIYIVKYFDKVSNEWVETEIEGNYKDIKMFQLFNHNNIEHFSYLIKQTVCILTREDNKDANRK